MLAKTHFATLSFQLVSELSVFKFYNKIYINEWTFSTILLNVYFNIKVQVSNVLTKSIRKPQKNIMYFFYSSIFLVLQYTILN